MAVSTLDAQATAIAARFVAAALTAPPGYATIRSSTANPPGAIGPTPAVVVSIIEGRFRTGEGGRAGEHSFYVRFYLDQTSDLERTEPALRKWLDVLTYQLRGAVQLGGTVDRAVVETYRIGVLSYGQLDYSGIELTVLTDTSEPWAAVA